MSNIFIKELNSYLYSKYDIGYRLELMSSSELVQALESLLIKIPESEYEFDDNILNIGFYDSSESKIFYNIDDNYFLGFVDKEYNKLLDKLQNLPITNLHYYNLYLLFATKYNSSKFSSIGKQFSNIDLNISLTNHQSFHYLIFESILSNKAFINFSPLNIDIKKKFLLTSLQTKLTENCKTFFNLFKPKSINDFGLDTLTDKITHFIYSRLINNPNYITDNNRDYIKIKRAIGTYLLNTDININYAFKFSNLHIHFISNFKKFIIFNIMQNTCLVYPKLTKELRQEDVYLDGLEKIINNYLSTFFLYSNSDDLQQISYVVSYFESLSNMFINIHYYLFNYLINKLSDSFENFLLYDFINIINTAFIELNKTLDNTLLTDTTQSISDKLYFQYRDFLNSPLNKKFFIQDTYFIENYIKTLNIQGKITEINSVIRDLYIIGNTTNTITEEDDYIDDANIQTNTNDIYTNLINNETVLAEIDIFNPSNTTEIVPAEIDTITNLDYLDDGSLNLTKNELKDIVVVSLYDFILKEIDILLIKLEPYINDLFTILSQIDKNVPTLIEEFKGYLKILLMHYFTRDETTPTDTAERLLIDLNVFSIKNELYEFYLNYFQSYEGLDSLFTVDNISDATILNIQEDLQKFYFTAVGNRILNSMLAQYSFS